MIWGGGLLADWGVLDFAGGIVVHASAGMAALGAVLYLGAAGRRSELPTTFPFIALGTALLWFGWFGFNAGSELAVGQRNGRCVGQHAHGCRVRRNDLASNRMARARAGETGWPADRCSSRSRDHHAAAGFVGPGSAAIIGIVAGAVCYSAVKLKEKMSWDDALDVWAVHGIGGTIGVIMLGVFASTSVNPAGADGLINDGAAFFGKQVVAVLWRRSVRIGDHVCDARRHQPVRACQDSQSDEEPAWTRRYTERLPTPDCPDTGGRGE